MSQKRRPGSEARAREPCAADRDHVSAVVREPLLLLPEKHRGRADGRGTQHSARQPPAGIPADQRDRRVAARVLLRGRHLPRRDPTHLRGPRRHTGRGNRTTLHRVCGGGPRRAVRHGDRLARHGVDPCAGECKRRVAPQRQGASGPRKVALGIRLARRAVHPLVRGRQLPLHQHHDLCGSDCRHRPSFRLHSLRRLLHVVDRGGIRPAAHHRLPDRLALRGDGLRIPVRPDSPLPLRRKRDGIRPGGHLPLFLRILRGVRSPGLQLRGHCRDGLQGAGGDGRGDKAHKRGFARLCCRSGTPAAAVRIPLPPHAFLRLRRLRAPAVRRRGAARGVRRPACTHGARAVPAAHGVLLLQRQAADRDLFGHLDQRPEHQSLRHGRHRADSLASGNPLIRGPGREWHKFGSRARGTEQIRGRYRCNSGRGPEATHPCSTAGSPDKIQKELPAGSVRQASGRERFFGRSGIRGFGVRDGSLSRHSGRTIPAEESGGRCSLPARRPDCGGCRISGGVYPGSRTARGQAVPNGLRSLPGDQSEQSTE